MKILVGSYSNGIFEVSIDLNNKKFISSEKIIDVDKASYLINDNEFSYIYLKNKIQYAKINDNDVLLNEGACHLSFDNKNNLYYTSFYGDGLFKVIENNQVIKTFSYGDNSHIHYASYLEKQNLVGVVDLGLNKIYFYEDLKIKDTYTFNDNYGPRHFVSHHELPIIYVISELIPTIFVLEYKNEKWILKQEVKLEKGAGSAIRITKDSKKLFAAVRESNLLYHFSINENGLINLVEKVSTMGDHPRDFNIINDDNYLVVANMHSNNLTLFILDKDKLVLADDNFYLPQGASIIFYK